MSIYELAVGWAVTANERNQLRSELLTCERVLGVFSTARDDVLAVLFRGGPPDFDEWASTLEPEVAA